MEHVINKFVVDTRNKRIWLIKHHVRKDLLENLYLLEGTLQGALNVMRNSFLWDIRHKKNELERLIEKTRLKNKPIPLQAILTDRMETTKRAILCRVAEINDIEKRMEKISEDTYYNGIKY